MCAEWSRRRSEVRILPEREEDSAQTQGREENKLPHKSGQYKYTCAWLEHKLNIYIPSYLVYLTVRAVQAEQA